MGKGSQVDNIQPNSIAEEMGVEPGDRLLAINGQEMEDFIDYRFLCADEYLEIQLLKKNGEEWILEVEKEYDDDLGITFTESTFDGIKRCQNRCIFCFVDQMPTGMRETLYVKDDDYRMSFLHGNFVTLTNVKEKDLTRIIKLRLSPLYISVHSTNPQLRSKMLNNPKAGQIMVQLKKLAEAGIEFHTQIVLCPGVNDGPELEQTLTDLTSLYPALLSVAIVPVGLTAFRQGLYNLQEFTTEEAKSLVKKITELQKQNLKRLKDPLVYLGDEFYLMAGEPFPKTEVYGEFPQLENGIGMARLFLDDFEQLKNGLPVKLAKQGKITLATGVSGGKALQPVLSELKKIGNLEIDLQVVANNFFGTRVTASGLITGQDLIKALDGKNLGDLLIIPGTMLRAGEKVLLDNLSTEEISAQLGVPVETAGDAKELIDLIIGFSQ